jgi:hypothetical protein
MVAANPVEVGTPIWSRSFEVDDVGQVTLLGAALHIGTLKTQTPAGFWKWLERMAQSNLKDAVRALERDKLPDAHRRQTKGATGESAQTFLGVMAQDDFTGGGRAAAKEELERMLAAIEGLRGALTSYLTRISSGLPKGRPVRFGSPRLLSHLGASDGVTGFRSRMHLGAEALGATAQIFTGLGVIGREGANKRMMPERRPHATRAASSSVARIAGQERRFARELGWVYPLCRTDAPHGPSGPTIGGPSRGGQAAPGAWWRGAAPLTWRGMARYHGWPLVTPIRTTLQLAKSLQNLMCPRNSHGAARRIRPRVRYRKPG